MHIYVLYLARELYSIVMVYISWCIHMYVYVYVYSIINVLCMYTRIWNILHMSCYKKKVEC